MNSTKELVNIPYSRYFEFISIHMLFANWDEWFYFSTDLTDVAFIRSNSQWTLQ